MATEMQSTDKAMTAKDCKLLHQLEEIIQKEMGGFVRLGQALLEIRDKRLYRQSHKTFEAYCRDKWEFSSSYAKRLMRSSEVVRKLESVPIGTLLPTTESQARPLTTIDLEEVDDVWQECIERAPRDNDGNPVITAKHVQETVDFWKAADEDYEEPEVCEEEESDAEEFDVDVAGGRLRDWLRSELDRWPEKCRDEAAHWIREILEKEYGL